jgi:OOP family OmpA-OmpF porin
MEYNMKLSNARAAAVMGKLVTEYKISPERLRAFGVGALAPVASNRTGEGRAKNRRVELVEQ